MSECYAKVQRMNPTEYALGLFVAIPTGEPLTVRHRTRWVRLGVDFAQAQAWMLAVSGVCIQEVYQGQFIYAPFSLSLVP